MQKYFYLYNTIVYIVLLKLVLLLEGNALNYNTNLNFETFFRQTMDDELYDLPKGAIVSHVLLNI